MSLPMSNMVVMEVPNTLHGCFVNKKKRFMTAWYTYFEYLEKHIKAFSNCIESWIIPSSEQRHDNHNMILIARDLENLIYGHAMVVWILHLSWGRYVFTYDVFVVSFFPFWIYPFHHNGFIVIKANSIHDLGYLGVDWLFSVSRESKFGTHSSMPSKVFSLKQLTTVFNRIRDPGRNPVWPKSWSKLVSTWEKPWLMITPIFLEGWQFGHFRQGLIERERCRGLLSEVNESCCWAVGCILPTFVYRWIGTPPFSRYEFGQKRYVVGVRV